MNLLDSRTPHTMYNKGEGEEANAQGLEGGLQTEGLRQRRPIFPAGPTASPASVETPEMASPRLCITVAPFTGGPFEVRVAKSDTIEDLKKVIARRLKVAKERMGRVGAVPALAIGSALVQCAAAVRAPPA